MIPCFYQCHDYVYVLLTFYGTFNYFQFMLILLLTGLHGRSGNTEWITHLCYCIFQLHNKYYYYYYYYYYYRQPAGVPRSRLIDWNR